jgi:aldose sugar dehydrogenase
MQSTSFYFISAIVIGLAVTGCGSNSNTNATDKDTAATSAAPAPAKKDPGAPNSDYKPAFEGQTRITKVKTTTPYKVEKIVDNLGIPWAIIPFTDGRLLMTEKTGYMNILSADGAIIKKITGFPKVNPGGQGGLLDVALDPAFKSNKTIYWSYSENHGDSNLTAVAKGQLSEADGSIKNPVVIFRVTPALKSELHYGSRLLFDKDGYLFVSAGERSILEGRKQAQWLNSGLGKVFKITKDGKPAPGNPFINQPDAMPEIYSYGHRNPQSLDINPATGDLWEAEFGPRGGDEVNLVKPGKNYGWPTITYGIEYSGEKVGDGIQKKDGMEQPVYYWDPVASPSGMTFYSGDAIPEWKNNLFIACLSSTQVVRLVIENNKVVGEESLLSDKKERLRDVTQMDGKLYVVSDNGILFRVSKN